MVLTTELIYPVPKCLVSTQWAVRDRLAGLLREPSAITPAHLPRRQWEGASVTTVHLPCSELSLQHTDGERGRIRKKEANNSCPVSWKCIFFWEPLVSCVKWHHTTYITGMSDVMKPAALHHICFCCASESKQAKKDCGSNLLQTTMKTLNVQIALGHKAC